MMSASSYAVTLDEPGQRLLKLLVSKLAEVKPNDPRTFISYKQVHDALNLPVEGQTLGRSLQQQGLNSLANWTARTGVPGITGLIVDKEKLTPGLGYFNLYARQPDDFTWWLAEIQKAKSFDWTPFVSDNGARMESLAGDDWTSAELRAAVVAYLEMQRLDRESTKFTKKQYYDTLAARFGRSSKAFEYRMQNISYVLSLMGRDWLSGLKPARNVGAKVAAQIEKLIAEAENKSSTPIVAFEIEVREGIRKKMLCEPEGNRAPPTSVSSVSQYQRDPLVRAWVLKEARGVCECCEEPAPFDGVDGLPFLEVHHVRKLAENGPDIPSNAVAVCPNCHRALHYGVHAKELIESLYQRVNRLKRE